VDWIHLAQGRKPVADSCEHGNEPLGSIRGGKSLGFFNLASHAG
jgi:hypothetical protein